MSVGVVGGARVVEGKVDVTLTLKTVRDALDFLQNPNAITFVIFRLEIIERRQFRFHRLAALAPNDRVSGLQVAIKVVSARAISRHLLFPKAITSLLVSETSSSVGFGISGLRSLS